MLIETHFYFVLKFMIDLQFSLLNIITESQRVSKRKKKDINDYIQQNHLYPVCQF